MHTWVRSGARSPPATAAWDPRTGRRVAAATIAVALQGIFYWIILHESIEPTTPQTATSLEVTILETAMRPRPAALRRKPRPRRPPRRAAPARQAMPAPITVAPPLTSPPSARPAPPPAFDWRAAMRSEVRAEESASGVGKLRFGMPRRPVAAPAAAAQFGWDYARTHRVVPLPHGGLIINLTDHCAIAIYGLLLLPGCSIGRIPANGHLFDHLHGPGNDRLHRLP